MRRLIVLVVLALVVIVGATVLVIQLVTASPPVHPVAPAAVDQLQARWDDPIMLPADLPPCLTYAPDGASIVRYPDAGGQRAIQIKLAARDTPNCNDFATSNVVITEAPTLVSLQGEVTTVSYERMQFARAAAPAENGNTRVTLQWHCGAQMCRLSGVTGAGISQDTLAMIGNSFLPARS